MVNSEEWTVETIVLDGSDKSKWFPVDHRVFGVKNRHEYSTGFDPRKPFGKATDVAHIWGPRVHMVDAIDDAKYVCRRTHRKPKFLLAIRARNKTQVAQWLVDNGFTTTLGHEVIYPAQIGGTVRLNPNIPNPRERAIATAQAAIERAQAQIDRLYSLPSEPEVEPNEPNVVWFEKSFNGSRFYTYAAVKAGDGLWYTTGPNTPKGFSWDQLIDWIGDDTEVWHATDYGLI